jgi:putative spermidine/putrescine transport system ATP-binding protein
VALARALVIEPDVLLLDEPLSNLDAKLREQLRDDIRALQKRLGMTAIYVTHDQSEAMALADRVVLMNAGRIVEMGTPRSLYRQPAHRFTAEFLGHTNILSGRVDGGHIRFAWGEAGVAAIDPPAADGDVVVSVRPEDLVLTPADHGPGAVTEVAFLGADIEHKVALDGAILRSRSSGQTARVFGVGTRVAIRLPAMLHRLTDRAPSSP